MLDANLTKALRKKIYRRDGFRCALCDSTNGLQIHHIVHRSHGGTNLPANLITLCWKCHAVAHGTRIPDYPTEIDQEAVELACIEYISDYYAEMYGTPWNPWSAKGEG